MNTLADRDRLIEFHRVSKFYGEVLGVNEVDLEIGPGITSLVGPNGSGKTTLMNLMTGLLRPTEGTVRVLGTAPDDPEAFYARIGYCTQFDAFPRRMSGRDFVASFLRLHGYDRARAAEMAAWAIERVGLTEAAERRIGAYSKGMRQRIKLAQAIAHAPQVLVLDEPLNGLDPLARAETIALFRALAAEGLHLIISSHILHEVDILSDRVVMMNEGYVVAEGGIAEVRSEMTRHPLKVSLRTPDPGALAARLLGDGLVIAAALHDDGGGLVASTRDADAFFSALTRLVVDAGFEIDQLAPADEDIGSVYEYLIGRGGSAA